jgi:FG-GAP-like repeat
MSRSTRVSLRLIPALAALTVSSLMHAQESMMLRNNSSPVGGIAINRGDFNNDGIIDLVTANSSATNSVSVYLGRADGTFASPVNTATGHQANDLAFGDFNNDGKLDVAVSNIDSNTVQILLGNGNGTFTLGDTIMLDAVPASITTSDFNNDGKMDLAIGIGTTSNGGLVINEVEVLQGDGLGHFGLATTLGLGGTASLVTKVRVGDFNADGKVDIAVLQQTQLTVFTGNGDFTFAADVIQQYVQTNDMNTGDMNQDGFTDILVSWFDTAGGLSGGVDEFLGTTTLGGFLHATLIPSSTAYESPRQIIAADVNGDGINDVVGLDDDSTSANGVYVWTCDGEFEGSCNPTPTKFIYTTDRDKQALVAGDFNRDGKIDFAATEVSNSTLEVLLNATPRAVCQKKAVSPSVTVCQPQEATFSNSPLHIVASAFSNNPANVMDVYIDNQLQASFPSQSFDQFFNLPVGNHFVVVKGWQADGTSFRSDRHVTIFSAAAGQTCAAPSSTALSVNTCLPAHAATLHSPVQIFANSYSPRPITAIQVYIDNNLVFNDPTSTEVNKLFDMGLGSHFIVVKAWDATGNSVVDGRTITVN